MAKQTTQFLTTNHPLIVFEDNEGGRVKKHVFDAPMSEVEAILKEYEDPSPSELGNTERMPFKILHKPINTCYSCSYHVGPPSLV